MSVDGMDVVAVKAAGEKAVAYAQVVFRSADALIVGDDHALAGQLLEHGIGDF